MPQVQLVMQLIQVSLVHSHVLLKATSTNRPKVVPNRANVLLSSRHYVEFLSPGTDKLTLWYKAFCEYLKADLIKQQQKWASFKHTSCITSIQIKHSIWELTFIIIYFLF
jgi:hypothetical protein